MRLGFYPKFQAFDSNGNPLSGGFLYTYDEGTSTPRATYADVAGATPNDNPIVLDSRGEATIFLKGSYKFVLKTSAAVTIWTLDGLRGADFNLIIYADDDLAAAVTEAGATARTILVDQAITLADNLTIPANVNLWIVKGGVITVPTGKTLTINGTLNAGFFKIFNCVGTGAVAFGDGVLPEVYLEWWGGAGDGTTENGTALTAAFAAHSKVKLLEGNYLVTNTTVYLNSATTEYTYSLIGSGMYSTKITLAGYTTTYLFKVNEDAAAAHGVSWPSIPRLVISDLWFYGTGSTSPYLCYTYRANVDWRRITIEGFSKGLYAYAYCDRGRWDTVRWLSPKTDGIGWEQTNNGDAHIVQNCTFDGTTGYSLKWYQVRGAMVSGNIIGRVIYDSCQAIEHTGNHSESQYAGTHYLISVVYSSLSIRNNFLSNQDTGTAECIPIQINDTSAIGESGSQIVIEGNAFVTLGNAAGTTTRKADIHITLLSGAGSLNLENNRSAYNISGTTGIDNMGLTVTSDVAALQTALTNYQAILSEDVRIWYDGTVWQVTPMSGMLTYYTLGAAALGDRGVAGGVTGTIPNATTYYYRASLLSPGLIMHTQSDDAGANGVSIVSTGDNQAFYFLQYLTSPTAILRLWRCNTPAWSTDEYVDIPLCNRMTYLYDFGTHVNGFPWLSAAIPTITDYDDDTDMAGYLTPAGTRVFHAAAAPTSAEFSGIVGDTVWDTDGAAGATPGWRCTTAGTPGTWKAMASVAA